MIHRVVQFALRQRALILLLVAIISIGGQTFRVYAAGCSRRKAATIG